MAKKPSAALDPDDLAADQRCNMNNNRESTRGLAEKCRTLDH